MRCRVDLTHFANAVAAVARGLGARPANPLLGAIELRVVDDRLEVRGFDYEVATLLTVAAERAEPGRILVNGRLLGDVTKPLDGAYVDLASTDGTVLSIGCGSARFELSLVPLDEYPEPPARPLAFGVVSGTALRIAVAQVGVAAGHDDALPSLTGIRLEAREQGLLLVATDRYRIGEAVLPWLDAGPHPEIATLLPARTLDHLAKVLAARTEHAGTAPTEHSDAVTLGFHATDSGGWFGGWHADGRGVGARPIDAPFVRHDRFWPTDTATTVDARVAPLLGALRRVTVVAERYTPVWLRCAADAISLSARGSGADHAVEELPARVTGEPITIGFNPGYLLDALRELTCDSARLMFTTPTKPGVITATPPEESADADTAAAATFRYLVMSRRGQEG